jgi:hypothetical protein
LKPWKIYHKEVLYLVKFLHLLHLLRLQPKKF